jgi:TRAP-type C4-dicarboxylate transport system permease small subunit
MKYIVLFVKGILNIITIIENIICGIGMWLTVIFVFCGVVNRYFLHLPISWFGDLALFCFIFFMLIAAALTTREERHTSVDVFRQKLFNGKPKADTIYSIFLNVISIIIILIFLPVTWNLFLRALKYPEYATLIRWFNTSWLRSTLFFAVTLIFIHLLVSLAKNIGKLKEINTKTEGKR